MQEIETIPDAVRLRKQVIYRANHRGIKEMDIILGGYADAHCMAMDDERLSAFVAIMDESDRDLFTWFTGEAPVPSRFDAALFEEMLAFAQDKFTR